jgi:UDP-N-acetylglucosamine--N-acetylmuramyl-(pentapeptide) pyrophosphoryl-undecaprenol N-acetylglucosamine transferase
MRILVITGASGGHIFPAVGFLESLKERPEDIETLLVVPKRSLESYKVPEGYSVRTISTSPVQLRLNPKNVIALFALLQGTLESLLIFLAFKPDRVVGFGGLDTVPMVLMGWMTHVKTIIHEQNYLPGRANRLLARFSDRVAISFAQTRDYLKGSDDKIVLTGNLIRRSLKNVERSKALSFFKFKDDKSTILVMGGSRGSHKINTCFLNAVSTFPEARQLQIIHIGGKDDHQWLAEGYQDLDLEVKLFDFLKDVQYAYAAADLVICRAGATTITELTYFKIPAIIIPYPFAYQHQFHNAKLLEDYGCAVLLRDEECDPELLKKNLKELIYPSEKISRMRQNYNRIQELRGNNQLVELALSLN